MNGAADMGGMHGFGSVEIEPNEPVFHADWEKKAFALNMAIGVANIWNLDAFRFARESLPPPQYLNTSYYGLWVVTLETMMLKYGIATDEELKAGHALAPMKKADEPVTAAKVANMVRCGSPYGRPAPAPPKFKVGRQGARAQCPSENAHALATLRARAYRRGGACCRMPRLSRQQRDWRRRGCPLALHRAVRWPRIMGPGFRSDRQGRHRGLGTLFGVGMIDRCLPF